MRALTLFAPLLAAWGVASCALPPEPLDHSSPGLPAQWTHPVASPGADAATRAWWRSFGSAELDALIVQAQRDNVDAAVAAARLQAARATVRVAGATMRPRLDANVDAAKASRLGGSSEVESAYGAGFTTRYEVDFWGKNAALRDRAAAVFKSSMHDRTTVQLTVSAHTASAWLQVVSLRERSAIAALNLDTAERLLAMIEAQVRAGAATPLALAQQRGLVAGQERTVAALRQHADDAAVALSVVLGATHTTALEADSLQPLRIPSIDAGMPAHLLARRPDVARSEALLIAAGASVTAARAAMLPGLDLSASLGVGGARVRTWLDNPLYGLAAGLTAPILHGGALAGQRDLALAQRQEALADYRRAVVIAVAEVEAALNAIVGVDAQRTAQAIELAQARRALALAESRYRAGADSLLTLLDAQRSLYLAQDLGVQLTASRLQAAVALFKALGGGWNVAASNASAQGKAYDLGR